MRTGEKQSFAGRVREELIRLPAGKACCMLSEISALTQTSGHLAFRGGGWISVSYRLEDAGVARRLFQLLKRRLNVNPTLHFTQTSRLGGRRTCVLTLSGEDARTLLDALHMTETDENGQLHLKRTVPRHPMTRQCCRRAFLRGAFLGAGTVTNPEKAYHFEWKSDDSHLPQVLGKLLEKCDLPFHTYARSGQQVVYFKGAQQIADVLALMGAGQSVLQMENIRIRKQRIHIFTCAGQNLHTALRGKIRLHKALLNSGRNLSRNQCLLNHGNPRKLRFVHMQPVVCIRRQLIYNQISGHLSYPLSLSFQR